MRAISTLKAVEKYNWPYARTKVCEVTLNYNCNARCVFCYTSPEIYRLSEHLKLDVKLATKNMMDSYKDGARIIQFIGGEPTLYPQLDELIRIARKIGYSAIQIVTNGIKLSDHKFFDKLIKSGLNSVVFSVHAANSDIHNRVVGVNDAFKKILKALKFAVKNNIYITVGTAVTYLNYREVPNIVRLMYENYGIESYHFIATHFLGMAYKTKDKLAVSYSETKPYLLKAMDYLSSNRVLPVSPILSNYVPCILPGFENIISDWKLPYSADDDLYLPEKKYKDSMYTMITNTLRMKSKKCKKCIYYGICAGFEKEYYKEFGDKEFVPLKNLPRPYPLNIFYKR